MLGRGVAVAEGGDGGPFAMDLEIDLLAEHGHLLWCLDADPHLLPHDRQHRDLDLVADHDALVGLTRQNQHCGCTLPICEPGLRREPLREGLASIVSGPGERDPVRARFSLSARTPLRGLPRGRPGAAIGRLIALECRTVDAPQIAAPTPESGPRLAA